MISKRLITTSMFCFKTKTKNKENRQEQEENSSITPLRRQSVRVYSRGHAQFVNPKLLDPKVQTILLICLDSTVQNMLNRHMFGSQGMIGTSEA